MSPKTRVFVIVFFTFGILPTLLLCGIQFLAVPGRPGYDTIGATIVTSLLFLLLGIYLAFEEAGKDGN
ncbi:MAG: hypothetical protein ABL984_12470 [Pyrinomonadaceae bacterium]